MKPIKKAGAATPAQQQTTKQSAELQGHSSTGGSQSHRGLHDLERIKALVDAREIARRYGIKLGTNGQVRCFNHRAHSNGDRNPSMRIYADGYHCFGCGASGDVISLVQELEQCTFKEALQRIGGPLNISPNSGGSTVQLSGRPPIVKNLKHRLRRDLREPSRRLLKPYPPRAEVLALWEAMESPGDVPEVAAWLQSRDQTRGPLLVETEDQRLGLAITSRTPLPKWCEYWHEAGFRFVVPFYDAKGQLRSVQGRQIALPEPKDKSRWPTGCGVHGLVMANPLGRLMLQGDAGTELIRKHGLVIAEGIPDWLSWCVVERYGAAVLGIIAGTWSQAFADRIPDGVRVVIATHSDAAGERYLDSIVKTLRSRYRRGELMIVRHAL